jgi:selenocysteine-specific elongation factor
MHIIGTAGHVDHGKSSLVTALTGTNPDRWEEERARGMTLDIGFAYLRFADGSEAGIVDVPGHERFLHNMLAGAAGMELLLLVVDAVEGARAQTLEHLAILRLLDVQRVVVAASKIDRIPVSERDAALRHIEDELRGTIAEDAQLFGVSSTTGENVAQLREALHAALLDMPARNAAAPVYLPIDRVFTLPGLGTIVTGTLMQGSIAPGDRLRIEPGNIAAHVRSIGVFDTTRPRADAGARVALNLSGVDRHDVRRGQAVVGPEFGSATNFAVNFTPSTEAVGLLRRRTPVRAYIGSAELLGTLVMDEAPNAERELSAQLHLRAPVVAFSGLRFVVRRPSPMTLLGGGSVKRSGAAQLQGETSDEAAVRKTLRERGLQSVEVHELAAAANLREAAVFAAINALVQRGEAIRVARPRAYVDAAAARRLRDDALARLTTSEKNEPWAMGMTSIALSRALGTDEGLLVRVLEHFVHEGEIGNRTGYYATPGYQARLSAEQRAFFDHLVPLDETNPLLPIPFAGVASAVKGSRLAGAGKAFDTMLARGMLVKVGDDLYRGSQIARIVARVEAHLQQYGQMTAAAFRDLLGTSRKYAVPLLEWLDSHGVTLRNGDFRILRKKAG